MGMILIHNNRLKGLVYYLISPEEFCKSWPHTVGLFPDKTRLFVPSAILAEDQRKDQFDVLFGIR